MAKNKKITITIEFPNEDSRNGFIDTIKEPEFDYYDLKIIRDEKKYYLTCEEIIKKMRKILEEDYGA